MDDEVKEAKEVLAERKINMKNKDKLAWVEVTYKRKERLWKGMKQAKDLREGRRKHESNMKQHD